MITPSVGKHSRNLVDRGFVLCLRTRLAGKNKTFEINVPGAPDCARLLKESGCASIVNAGSVAGITARL
jgi:hypothetical protein